MDIYRELGLEPIINASGTITALGGSLMPAEVIEAMVAGSHAFVDMHELHRAAGKRIAELIGVEAAHICAGASAGIALMAAACMTGGDAARIAQLPDTTGIPYRFIVQRVHRQPYEQALRVPGGQIVEVDPEPAALQAALDMPDVAGVFFTHAWFLMQKPIPLPRVAELAHRYNVPVIVDAAAEVPPVENLWRFVKEGADLVAFSGGKAIRGPQSSGFIVGRADLIEACRRNDCPYDAIGRSMKACKEEIVGLVKAVELYVHRDHNREALVWDRRVARMLDQLAGLPHVRAVRQMPYGVGQQIPHVALSWDVEAIGLTYDALEEGLRNGKPRITIQRISPSIYGGGKFGYSEIRIHPHTLREGEDLVVAERVRELLGG
ncbi:MAG: aminotransferase class V-fold PLP-dependent enzyme [Anaerolineae bacterium]|nr:aminotransferase class V-fold PLP-dependent enzyme [Anaerolineae bacterium]